MIANNPDIRKTNRIEIQPNNFNLCGSTDKSRTMGNKMRATHTAFWVKMQATVTAIKNKPNFRVNPCFINFTDRTIHTENNPMAAVKSFIAVINSAKAGSKARKRGKAQD